MTGSSVVLPGPGWRSAIERPLESRPAQQRSPYRPPMPLRHPKSLPTMVVAEIAKLML
jgi:hypothetical protein